MGHVTWWAVLSSGSAPVLLLGGSATAAVVEGPDYNPVKQTISVLAADNQEAYWALTATLLALGLCHLATAAGLRAAALAGRLALGGGGVSAMLLAFFPAPATGGSLSHGSVVTVGFAMLALWPVLAAWRRPAGGPWGLRRAPSWAVTGLMLLGAAWFVVENQRHGPAGVAERVVTAATAVWPVVVVISCLLHRPATGAGPGTGPGVQT